MSPFNKRITCYRRTTTRTTGGGFAPSDERLFRSIPASIQAARPGAVTIQFGAEQVPVTHHLYTRTDVSSLAKEDIVTEDESGTDYVVLAVTDMAGQGRMWRIDSKRK